MEEQLNEFITNVLKKLSSQQNEISELKAQLSLLSEQLKLVETKSLSGASQSSESEDLTKLTAYKYAAAFKEVKRPTTLNELYMMVLQSQHNIYELQMNTDNILRRT